jgi:hypothetical protein
MHDATRSIFREDALRRYADGRDQTLLPRFVSQRAVGWLWALLGLLLAGGVTVWVAVIGQLGGS